MAGHNKWKQIKHKKASADQARGKLFSKLANTISVAAREGADPQFNPALRSAIEQAKRQNMPMANIERAIKRASEKGALEPLLIEAYGPEGVGVLVYVATDNKNRSVGELRTLFKEHDAKLADPGSLLWSFEKTPDGYRPAFTAPHTEDARERIQRLVGALEERDDVIGVYTAIDASAL